MFPYRIARTNSPYGYYIRYTGRWTSCRNVGADVKFVISASGNLCYHISGDAKLTILLEDENQLDYRFNNVRVYCETTGVNLMLW
ncbi:MAG: hypothetical protein R2757_21980 [Draconibacterium sp.]